MGARSKEDTGSGLGRGGDALVAPYHPAHLIRGSRGQEGFVVNPSRLVVCIAIAGLTAGASAKLPAAPGHAQETTKPTPAKASPLDAILAEPEVTLLADGFRFTEGPCWHDGALYFCDLQASKLYKWTPDNSTEEAWDGEASVFLDDSAGAAGIFVDRQGRMVVTHFGQKVTRSNDEGGFDTIADECDGKPLGSANDLVVAADGTIYFTNPNRGDSSTSGVCRLDTDGTVSLIVNDTAFPNGVHLSPDGKTLYFTQYAKNIVKAVELADDGSAGEVRTFIDLSEAGGARAHRRHGDRRDRAHLLHRPRRRVGADPRGSITRCDQGPRRRLELCVRWCRREDALHHVRRFRVPDRHEDRYCGDVRELSLLV